MIIGWAINSAMILMAAATFFQPQNAKQVDDLATAGKMLTPLLGNAGIGDFCSSASARRNFIEHHRGNGGRNDFFGNF